MTTPQSHLRFLLILLLALLAVPSLATAQDLDPLDPNITPEQAEAALRGGEKLSDADGWKFTLNLGANLSLNHSSKVVGATDGLTVQIGALFGATADLISGKHEWSNGMNIEHGQTKTPLIDSFVKSTDNFEIRSLYVYRVVDWFGPYARVKMATQLLPGYDIRPEATTYQFTDANGAVDLRVAQAQEEAATTGAFEPIVLIESIGALATPINRPAIRVDAKLGVGGQHIFANGGYAVVDDEDTAVVELKEIETSHALGGEFELELSGKVSTNVTWGIIASLFYPFVVSDDQGLGAGDLLHTDLGASLSVKLASWLSLDYNLSAKRLPLILDEWQVQNLLLLTAGFNFVWPEPFEPVAEGT